MKFVFSKKQKISYKKILLVIVLLLLAMISTIQIDFFASADENDEFSESLSNSVYDIVEGIDVSEIQNMVDNLEDINLFDVSIKDKITQILEGEYFTNYTSVASAIFALVFGDIREIIPFLFTLIAIGVLYNLIYNFKTDNKNTNDVVSFVFLSVMIIVVLIAFKDILDLTNRTINLILTQMQIIFPILITLLGTIGSFSSISIYNPLVAVLTSAISIVFDKFLYPLFITIFLFTVIGHLTDTIKLNKINSFLSSTFKWVIGIVFTLFTGFLSIQGISAGKFDSVSIKATKFAMKSYIPIIGSYVSDGMDFFILGSVLVKNTIGLIGVLILFVSIISPIITILIYKLALQLSGGILEMTGSTKMSNFLTNCSKILIMPIVLIIGIAFMYVITICLIMCTANIF